jgi:DNA-binding response OmpR family regulator
MTYGAMRSERDSVITARLKPPDVLIAEDDEALRRMLEVALRAMGLEVLSVGDGRALSEELDAGRQLDLLPAVVLTDLAMPSLTGIDVLAETVPHTRRPTFVVITGTVNQGLMDLARQLGAAELFSKPFDVRLLCARVCEHVQRARAATSPRRNDRSTPAF